MTAPDFFGGIATAIAALGLAFWSYSLGPEVKSYRKGSGFLRYSVGAVALCLVGQSLNIMNGASHVTPWGSVMWVAFAVMVIAKVRDIRCRSKECRHMQTALEAMRHPIHTFDNLRHRPPR